VCALCHTVRKRCRKNLPCTRYNVFLASLNATNRTRSSRFQGKHPTVNGLINTGQSASIGLNELYTHQHNFMIFDSRVNSFCFAYTKLQHNGSVLIVIFFNYQWLSPYLFIFTVCIVKLHFWKKRNSFYLV